MKKYFIAFALTSLASVTHAATYACKGNLHNSASLKLIDYIEVVATETDRGASLIVKVPKKDRQGMTVKYISRSMRRPHPQDMAKLSWATGPSTPDRNWYVGADAKDKRLILALDFSIEGKLKIFSSGKEQAYAELDCSQI